MSVRELLNPEPTKQVSCIPVAKLHDKAHGQGPVSTPTCQAKNFVHFTQLYLAMEQLAEDCGLTGGWVVLGVAEVSG